MSPTPDLSIAVIFYNEEKNAASSVAKLIAALAPEIPNYEVIAVNNGSTDSTPEVLEKISTENTRVKLAAVEKNIGYGFGVITGLAGCAGKYIGYIDGDGQFNPESVVLAYKKMRTENLDLCKAYRTVRQYDFTRKFLSFGFNILLQLVFGLRCRDINGKPKLMRREVFSKLALKSKDWFIDSEIILKSAELGYKTGDVPTTYKKRGDGKSSVRFATAFEFAKNIIMYRILKRT
jgi:glycosyltransferase involved in cell wall biosynthesis